MALRLAVAGAPRGALLHRGASPFPPVRSPPGVVVFSRAGEYPCRDPSGHLHRRLKAPAAPSFRRVGGWQWVGSTRRHEWALLQQEHAELRGRHRRGGLLSPAAMSTSSSGGAAEEAGKRNSSGEKVVVAPRSWVERYLPRSLQPYALLARLDKPIGSWLLAWPCMWSIAMAAAPGSLPDLQMLAFFGCGAVIMRGAACTINDILDRDFDRKVDRTKSRPMASGLVTPFQGLLFLGFQVLLGLGMLLPLDNFCRILGASWLPLAFTYPLMKRITYWPQAYLGLFFSWGALLGWAAVRGSIDPAIIIPLYNSGVFWTLVYDTIYAHQDKEDDLKVGVKSTALKFGDLTKNWITGFGIACISSLALSGFNAQLAWPYYTFLTLAAGQLGWQIWTVDLANGADCGRKFVSNKWFGALVFGGILLGRLAS